MNVISISYRRKLINSAFYAYYMKLDYLQKAVFHKRPMQSHSGSKLKHLLCPLQEISKVKSASGKSELIPWGMKRLGC